MPEDTTPQERVQAFVDTFRYLRRYAPNQTLIQMLSLRTGQAAKLHVDDLEALLEALDNRNGVSYDTETQR